jgi:hypothetical protein
MLGIAFTGGGLKDDELTTKQQETAMFVSVVSYGRKQTNVVLTELLVVVHHADYVVSCRYPGQMVNLLYTSSYCQQATALQDTHLLLYGCRVPCHDIYNDLRILSL